MASDYSMGADKQGFDCFGAVTTGDKRFCCAKPDDKLLSPESTLIRLWQAFTVSNIFVCCVMSIYMVTFDSLSLGPWVICYISDVLFLIDFILNFYITYQDKRGGMVSDRRHVICHYLITAFTPDVLSMLPLELLGYAMTSVNLPGMKLVAVLRLNRLIRFYKCVSFFISREAELGANTAVIRSIRYGTICTMTLHTLVCIWYTIACEGYHSSRYGCYQHSWAVQDVYMTEFLPEAEHIKDGVWQTDFMTVFSSYLTCFYWTIATATSTGYGDISAVNTEEEAISIVSMLIGIGVFVGMTLGGMASMITNFDLQRASYLHKFNVIIRTLSTICCEDDLKEQVIGYYDYLWARRKGEPITDIYRGLPLTFVAEISYDTYKPLLDKAHLFDDLEPGFLRMLSLLIHPVLFLPQQIICARGDTGHQMFFVHRGEVEILSDEDDETPVATLKTGKLFGELSLAVSLQKTATVRAVTHCDLLCLEKEDLSNLLQQYPQIKKQIQAYAQLRLDNIERILSEKNTKAESSHCKAFQRKKTSFIEPSKLAGDIRKSSFHIASSSLEFPTVSSVHMGSDASILHHPLHESFHHKDHHMPHISITSSIEALEEVLSQDGTEEISVVSPTCCQSLCSKCQQCLEWFNSVTIDPDSWIIQIWQKLVLITTILLCIVLPYMACFTAYDQRTGYTETNLGITVLFITYVCDVILLLDILIHFRTGIATPHGTLTDFKDIVNHYCKSWPFVCDIISVLPLELGCLFIANYATRVRIFPFLKLNRLVKVYNIPVEFSKKEGRMEGSVLLLRFCKLVLYVVLLTHWVACLLYVVVCFGSECKDGSWIVVFANQKQKAVKELDPTTEYITALYWATATLTSTGYGDISAHTTVGRWFSLCAMVLGFFLYGYCLSILAATLTNMDAPRVKFQEKLFAIKDFMQNHNLDTALQEKVSKYLVMMWDKYGGQWMPGDRSIIHDIPLALRKDIAVEDTYGLLTKTSDEGMKETVEDTFSLIILRKVYLQNAIEKSCDLITKCPLFKDLDVSFIRMLSVKLVTYTFSPGDVIIYAGDLGREMYFIRRGVCQYISTNKNIVLEELSDGDYFGDLSMLMGDYQLAQVTAKTHVEALELRLEDLEECMKGFPLIKEQFDRIFEDKDLHLRIKAKLKEKINMAEVDLEGSWRTATPEEKDKKTKQTKNSKIFTKDDKDLWNDYMQLFEDIKPRYRCLAQALLLKRTFLPEGGIMKYWMTTAFFISLTLSMTIPVQAAFLYQSAALWVLHYIIDITCFINLYLGLHMAYYNEQGILVTHPLMTAKQYLRTNFTIDLLGCLPFEVFALIFDSNMNSETLHLVAIFRITRLLQLYRMPLVFATHETRVDMNVNSIKHVKFVLFIFIFLNTVTCIFFMMACPPKQMLSYLGTDNIITNKEGHHCISDSWITSPNLNYTLADANFITLQIISAYFATATTVSVGYGEISATSNVEMVITLIIMIAGILLFGYCIASIAASLANSDAQKASFKRKLDGIKNYMEDQEIWRPLQKKTIAYYEYVWQRTSGVDPETLFNGLPLSLWEDITYSLYEESLSKISWFKGSDRSFFKTLSRYIKPIIFRKADYIVRKSDIGSEVYFILKGIVDVVSDDGLMVFESLTEGQSFGEDAWFYSCPRSSTVRARTNCDLFILTKEDLDFVLESYPNLKDKITIFARAELSKAHKIYDSEQMRNRSEMAKERRESSKMYKSFRWEDLKLLDPESGGFEEPESDRSEKRASVVSYKAKPRRSIAAGAIDEDGAGAINLPPGLRDFHKRLSLAVESSTVVEDEEDDDTYEEISAVTVPRARLQQMICEEDEEENNIASDGGSSQHSEGTNSQNTVLTHESDSRHTLPTLQPTEYDSDKGIGSAESGRGRRPRITQQTEYGSDESVRMAASDRDKGLQLPQPAKCNSDQELSEKTSDGVSNPENGNVNMDRSDGSSDVNDNNNVNRNNSLNDQPDVSTRRRSRGHSFRSGQDMSISEEQSDDYSVQTTTSSTMAVNTVQDSDTSIPCMSHASIIHTGKLIPLESMVSLKLGILGRMRNFTISPSGWFYLLFSQFVCLLALLSGWLLTYQVAFQDHDIVVCSLNYVIDFIYLIEIFVKFRLHYSSQTGETIEDPRLVAKYYLKHGFVLDIIAAVPIEIMALAASSGSKMLVLSILRLNRLLRLLKLPGYFSKWDQDLHLNVLLVRSMMFLVMLPLTIHACACGFYVLACPFGECKPVSWAAEHNFRSSLEAYITCVYWCLATMTSTGYGDITPHTLLEMVFANGVMIAGKMQIGLILANVASILANEESERVTYDQKLHTVHNHMCDQGVSRTLQSRVIKYFNYLWHRNKGRDMNVLFKDAPYSLRADIFLHVTRDMIDSIPLFECVDDSFMRQISQRINQVFFLPGDYITIRGDVGREMCYIHRGKVEIVNEDDPTDCDSTLSQGDIFGEVSLVCSAPRRVTIRAQTCVDLFTLSKQDLDDILQHYPELLCEIKKQAQERFAALLKPKGNSLPPHRY